MKAIEVELQSFLTWALEEGGSHLHFLAALTHGEKTLYSLNRMRDGPQGWPGKEKNLLPLIGYGSLPINKFWCFILKACESNSSTGCTGTDRLPVTNWQLLEWRMSWDSRLHQSTNNPTSFPIQYSLSKILRSSNEMAAKCKSESDCHINSGDWQNTSRQKTQGKPPNDGSLHGERFIPAEWEVAPVLDRTVLMEFWVFRVSGFL